MYADLMRSLITFAGNMARECRKYRWMQVLPVQTATDQKEQVAVPIVIIRPLTHLIANRQNQ